MQVCGAYHLENFTNELINILFYNFWKVAKIVIAGFFHVILHGLAATQQFTDQASPAPPSNVGLVRHVEQNDMRLCCTPRDFDFDQSRHTILIGH